MKVKDLFEDQKIIEGNVRLPTETTKLNYKDTVVKGYFHCRYTNITSLEGAPKKVGDDFDCVNTNITSLKGAPEYVGGNFNCAYNNISSLHNIHNIIKYIGGRLILPETARSNVLGVVLIKGLQLIGFYNPSKKQHQVESIINKHLKGDRDIHACQEELLEAGLTEFAKL